MFQKIFLLFSLICFTIQVHPAEINYRLCTSLSDVILLESEEISRTSPSDLHELAELYASRGESHLLNSDYEAAVNDFETSIKCSTTIDVEAQDVIFFRSSFGLAVAFDNLGIPDKVQDALKDLMAISQKVGCSDCIEDMPCSDDNPVVSIHSSVMNKSLLLCASYRDMDEKDDYDDIGGPENPPSPRWCEEVVVGTGRAMDAIACLAPNYAVKVILIGVIEALVARGVKCCQAGGFWKACVAPLARKWREWKENKDKNLPPSKQNLPLYMA